MSSIPDDVLNEYATSFNNPQVREMARELLALRHQSIGWIEWTGTGWPFAAPIEVRLRNGKTYKWASGLQGHWGVDGDNPIDIVAYRVGAPTPSEGDKHG